MTFSLRNCDRPFIRLSVTPSLRYSRSASAMWVGSVLVKTKGRTATESVGLAYERYATAAAATPHKRRATTYVCLRTPGRENKYQGWSALPKDVCSAEFSVNSLPAVSIN